VIHWEAETPKASRFSRGRCESSLHTNTALATGTLAFVDRRMRAELRGSTWGAHFHLHGKMTGVDDGTIWKLELVGRLGEDRISGSFVEIYLPSIPAAHACAASPGAARSRHPTMSGLSWVVTPLRHRLNEPTWGCVVMSI